MIRIKIIGKDYYIKSWEYIIMDLTEPNNKNFLTFGTSKQFIIKLAGFLFFLFMIGFVLKETAVLFTVGAALVFLVLAFIIPKTFDAINSYANHPLSIWKILFVLVLVVLVIGVL